MNRRHGRVSITLQRELGQLIDETISVPRLAPMTSVTRVECTADFATAHVYISALGDDKVREGSLEALQSAAGYLRRAIDKRIHIRHVPRLVFHLDSALIEGAEMLKMMDEVARQDSLRPRLKEVSDEVDTGPESESESELESDPGAELDGTAPGERR